MVQPYARVNSSWAIASFLFVIVGILGLWVAEVDHSRFGEAIYLFCVLGFPPLGFFCGIIALAHIARNRDSVSGLGWAMAGIVPSATAMLLIGMVFFNHPRASMKTSCLNNLKQIGCAISMYSSDWDDRYPLVSGPGREFERVYGWTWNYRTNSRGGERRWLQNVVGPYAKNKRIFMCPAVGEDGKWIIPGKGTVTCAYNRHGGVWNPEDPERIDPPAGSTTAGLKLKDDPPTSYWFNAVTVDKAGKGGTMVISGQSEAICDRTADAPLVWDTPCGFDAGTGRGHVAHEDCINVAYADGHAKPLQIPNARLDEWTKNHFGNTHGFEGWFPE